jgi:hypothetical protein
MPFSGNKETAVGNIAELFSRFVEKGREGRIKNNHPAFALGYHVAAQNTTRGHFAYGSTPFVLLRESPSIS